MRSPFVRVDVIHVRVKVFRVLLRVLEGDLVADPFRFSLQIDYVAVERLAGPVEMLDVLDDPAGVEELSPFAVAIVVEP